MKESANPHSMAPSLLRKKPNHSQMDLSCRKEEQAVRQAGFNTTSRLVKPNGSSMVSKYDGSNDDPNQPSRIKNQQLRMRGTLLLSSARRFGSKH